MSSCNKVNVETRDLRHVDLHSDCVAQDLRTGILALTCYELDPSSSVESQTRNGNVYFYRVYTNTSGSEALQDLGVQLDDASEPVTCLSCPAGVFDLRWSFYGSLQQSTVSILNLALSDGTIRRYEIELVNTAPAASHSTVLSETGSFVRIRTLKSFSSEISGDLALGIDTARLASKRIACGSEEDCDNDLLVQMNTSDDALSELAAVGYQSGAISVFHLGASDSPVWSCGDAHMAEVWQTQWLVDDSYEKQFKQPVEMEGMSGTSDKDFSAYGRSVGSMFVSGSDDASFKMWDLRRDGSSGPVAQNKKYYQMGVTSFASPMAAPCPLAQQLLPNAIIIGSYDETLSVWDLRQLTRPVNSISLGGGVWRMRWLPNLPMSSPYSFEDTSSGIDGAQATYLAVAAMHAGFKVVRISSSGIAEVADHITQGSFELEESCGYWGPHKGSSDGKFPPLAYGIDWACNPFSPRGKSASLASCTFYDNCMSLWTI